MTPAAIVLAGLSAYALAELLLIIAWKLAERRAKEKHQKKEDTDG